MKLRDSLTDVDVSLALCAQTAPEFYFPEGTAGSITRQSLNAKALCFECPIISSCFESAMETNWLEDWGIWGATTRHERADMRRKPFLLKEHRENIREALRAQQIEGEAA